MWHDMAKDLITFQCDSHSHGTDMSVELQVHFLIQVASYLNAIQHRSRKQVKQNNKIVLLVTFDVVNVFQ